LCITPDLVVVEIMPEGRRKMERAQIEIGGRCRE
jgi:hypothetical protein